MISSKANHMPSLVPIQDEGPAIQPSRNAVHPNDQLPIAKFNTNDASNMGGEGIEHFIMKKYYKL
jgi:hypothetical protein